MNWRCPSQKVARGRLTYSDYIYKNQRGAIYKKMPIEASEELFYTLHGKSTALVPRRKLSSGYETTIRDKREPHFSRLHIASSFIRVQRISVFLRIKINT
jgi:hypothetical protein